MRGKNIHVRVTSAANVLGSALADGSHVPTPRAGEKGPRKFVVLHISMSEQVEYLSKPESIQL